MDGAQSRKACSCSSWERRYAKDHVHDVPVLLGGAAHDSSLLKKLARFNFTGIYNRCGGIYFYGIVVLFAERFKKVWEDTYSACSYTRNYDYNLNEVLVANHSLRNMPWNIWHREEDDQKLVNKLCSKSPVDFCPYTPPVVMTKINIFKIVTSNIFMNHFFCFFRVYLRVLILQLQLSFF